MNGFDKVVIAVAAGAILAAVTNAAVVWRDQAVQAARLDRMEEDIKDIKYQLGRLIVGRYNDSRSPSNREPF